MSTTTFRVAMIRDTFFGPYAAGRLDQRLVEARREGAGIAVLPELPLNPWSPATREPRAEDAEEPGGARHRALADAAARNAIAIVGGAVVVDPASGRRHNTALSFDATGALIARYRKVHIPHEEGFWERDHYEPGDDPPERVDSLAMPFGVQLCSDLNRPEGCHILGALGAELVIAPRATEAETWERWRLVARANAITSCCHIVTVPRPGPENGVGLGGPSAAIGPDGDVLAETEEPVCVVALDLRAVSEARGRYPGYLSEVAELYARGWQRAAGSERAT